ncbi:MAG: TRAP transporter substrate-binding protein [Synergistaceae bacterium]|jgi:C4-dicarboxylate-binding protein DctP|nr:TRAP transporter substrate-binding protein [Synergistaceae bacterium]
MKKFGLCLFAAVLFLAVVSSDAANAASIKLRTSTNLAATGTVGRGLTRFVELVSEKSGGRIEATANYGAELGNQREQVEMCRSGSLEMVVAAPGTGPGMWVPQLMMFEFPYLFKGNEHYRRVLKGLEAEVSALVQPYGFLAAAGQSQGSRHMLTVKPVEKLADLAGLKMRGPNAIYISMFDYLGAAGTTTDWNEIYTAMQTKVIDGMEASPSMINSMKFQDNAKNLTITDHIIACVYYFFNEKWLNGLPDDLRKIVLDCAAEATVYQAEIDDLDQKQALEAMIKDGVVVHELSDADAWVKACAPMLDEYRAKGPGWSDFIDKMLAIE